MLDRLRQFEGADLVAFLPPPAPTPMQKLVAKLRRWFRLPQATRLQKLLKAS